MTNPLRRAFDTVPDRREGFALVAVLAALAVLIPLASRVVIDTTVETRLAANLTQRAILEAVAEAGINLAILKLLQYSEGAEAPAPAASSFSCLLSEALVTVSVEDEAGKLDLNLSPPELLRRLLKSVVPDEALAARLTQSIEERRRGGVEGAFLSVDEMGALPDLPPAAVSTLRSFLSVHSMRPGIDLDVASKALLDRLSEKPDRSDLDPYASHSLRRTFAVHATAAMGTKARYAASAIVELDPGRRPPFRLLQWMPSRAVKRAALPVAPRYPEC